MTGDLLALEDDLVEAQLRLDDATHAYVTALASGEHVDAAECRVWRSLAGVVLAFDRLRATQVVQNDERPRRASRLLDAAAG